MERKDLLESLYRINDQTIILEIRSGSFNDEGLNRTIHKFLNERKHIATRIVNREYADEASYEAALSTVQRYNEDLRKLLMI